MDVQYQLPLCVMCSTVMSTYHHNYQEQPWNFMSHHSELAIASTDNVSVYTWSIIIINELRTNDLLYCDSWLPCNSFTHTLDNFYEEKTSLESSKKYFITMFCSSMNKAQLNIFCISIPQHDCQIQTFSVWDTPLAVITLLQSCKVVLISLYKYTPATRPWCIVNSQPAALSPMITMFLTSFGQTNHHGQKPFLDEVC